MAISAKNKYEKVDILFGDQSFLDTESFFKKKGLIKSEKLSFFTFIVNKLTQKAS